MFLKLVAGAATAAGLLMLGGVFMLANSAFQETSLAASATAFFALAILASVVQGFSELSNRH